VDAGEHPTVLLSQLLYSCASPLRLSVIGSSADLYVMKPRGPGGK
jgi:hypothetical protein